MVVPFQRNTAEPASRQIQAFLRAQIQSGAFAPGARLPSNDQLARRWRVSSRDVQAALAGLKADGLVERARKRGTFVTCATKKMTVAIVFGPRLTVERFHFYRAVKDAFVQALDDRDWQGRVYDGLNDEHGLMVPENSLVCRHLADDLGQVNFNGLIVFGTNIDRVAPLARAAGLRRVVYDTGSARSDLVLDSTALVRESLAHLAGKGVKRVAYLGPGEGTTADAGHCDAVRAVAGELGLAEPIIAALGSSAPSRQPEADAYQAARRLVATWRAGGAARWPEAILVSDDIATRSVALALIESGMAVPGEVFVMTEACAGVELHYGIPVARYEFSPPEIAAAMLALLEKRIRDEPLPLLPIVLRGRIKEPPTR